MPQWHNMQWLMPRGTFKAENGFKLPPLRSRPPDSYAGETVWHMNAKDKNGKPYPADDQRCALKISGTTSHIKQTFGGSGRQKNLGEKDYNKHYALVIKSVVKNTNTKGETKIKMESSGKKGGRNSH